MAKYRDKIIDVRFVKGRYIRPFEYLCRGCGQLRLSFVNTDTCGNCGSFNIVKGEVGTLKKE